MIFNVALKNVSTYTRKNKNRSIRTAVYLIVVRLIIKPYLDAHPSEGTEFLFHSRLRFL